MHQNQAGLSPWGRYLLLFLFTPSLMVSSMVDSDWIYADENITDRVQVFDLYPEDNVNSSAIVKLLFNESSILPPCTVCFWLCPAYFNTTSLPFTLASPNFVFFLALLEGKLQVGVNDTCYILSKNLDAFTWYHLCTVVGNKSLSLYVNNETHEIDFASMMKCEIDIDMHPVSVKIGYEYPYSFTGKISNVEVFPRQLTSLEIKEKSQCKGNRGGSSLNFTVESSGGDVAETDLLQMCKKPPREFLALFEELNTQADARCFCSLLGGRLVNGSDIDILLKHEITFNKDVMYDSFIFWTNDSFDDVDGYVVIAQRSKYPLTVKYTKSSQLPVIGCMIGFGEPILLKSDIVEKFYSFPFKGRLIFQSKNGFVIYKDKCPKKEKELNDCLVAKAKSTVFLYSELDMNRQPVGRRRWACPYSGKTCNRTLTRCNEEQFTCSNGQCIDLDNKCDGRPQCRDESDEGGICYNTKKSSSYLSDMCPEDNPKVEVKVRIDSIQEIAMVNNALRVILSFTTTWRDSRITFMNLDNETTPVSPEEAGDLWYPEINFVNAQYEDNLNIRSSDDVVPAYSLNPEGTGQLKVRDSFEVREFNGSFVNIDRAVQYLFTFQCNYNYTYYPFDTQECYMILKLVKTTGCSPTLKNNSSLTVESLDSKLSMYKASKAHYCTGKARSGEELIVVHLLLERSYGSQLLTIFIPCIILCFLSMITLTHFQLSMFADRISVTLQLLLVLASLFSQVSSTLPESPEPKLVDMFFSYCIVKVSFVFVLHCIIESYYDADERQPKDAVGDVDPIIDIYKKIAWLTQEQELSTQNKSKVNIPRLINRIGIVLNIIADACVTLAFAYLAESDRREKQYRMNKLTTSSESERLF